MKETNKQQSEEQQQQNAPVQPTHQVLVLDEGEQMSMFLFGEDQEPQFQHIASALQKDALTIKEKRGEALEDGTPGPLKSVRWSVQARLVAEKFKLAGKENKKALELKVRKLKDELKALMVQKANEINASQQWTGNSAAISQNKTGKRVMTLKFESCTIAGGISADDAIDALLQHMGPEAAEAYLLEAIKAKAAAEQPPVEIESAEDKAARLALEEEEAAIKAGKV